MIDIENYIITRLAEALGTGVTVYDSPDSMAKFPGIVVSTTNRPLRKTRDNSLQPHHTRLTVQVDVYTNKNPWKTEIKNIIQTVDSTMQDMKFFMDEFRFLPNMDISIHRGTARFSVIVREGVTVGDLTTYQMYR